MQAATEDLANIADAWLARFEAALGERSDNIREKFYAENFLRIFPNERVT